MRHFIAIRRALICIYRFSLMICLALSMSCEGGCCIGNHKKNKKSPTLSQQPLCGKRALLNKNNAPKQDHTPEGVNEAADLDLPDALEPPIKKVKKITKWVAKVGGGKQVIVLLHGLARISYDFKAMTAVLERVFPYVTIIALKSVDKDSNKEKSSSLSSKLSIRDQARLAYEEIKARVPRGSHVVLVGHSQGGLRAFTLVKEYAGCLKRENGIVISKLITIGTPWKGAPIFNHIKNVKEFNQNFDKIASTLDVIKKGYGEAVRGYFFKKAPEFARNHPKLYQKVAPWVMKWAGLKGALDLDPQSDFIRHYVASALENFDVPITAIAGVCTDFYKLFEPFPSSITPQELDELNAAYAALIGDDPNCEHDMLLPVSTQHAEGLVKKNFQCIKVEGACHGNKVGVSVKPGISELNNKEVIGKVAESIEKAFYEEKEEAIIEQEHRVPPAA